MKLKIEIANLTEAQAAAIEDMLAMWESLGSVGSSRWICFFVDFRPKITINGRKPQAKALGKWKSFKLIGSGYDEGYFLDPASLQFSYSELPK